ncbi:LCP family protein [Clostridium bowmanii]|nr:LCP family protein [Clostridium bowmanii]
MKLWIKIVLSIFVSVLLVTGVAFSYTFYQLGKINTTKISKTDVDLGIKPKAPLKEIPGKQIPAKEIPAKEKVPLEEDNNDILNIAFFGLDRRDVSEVGRSDSIMILSIDSKHKKIKMSSIMRDTYVKINGHGQTKINHAYAYGGAQLAIRTLNENFNLEIRDYVTVDFFNFEKIIDAMGGVNIDIKQDEVGFINDKIIEVSNLEKKSIVLINKLGPQTLNGLQSVAYSRVRYTDGGDFVRTERQRTILSAMLIKIQSLGVAKFPSVVSELLAYTETSMKSTDILKIGTKVFTSKIKILEQERFPVDGYCKGKIIDGVWYLVTDMKDTKEQLYKFIYEDIRPVAKAPLF